MNAKRNSTPYTFHFRCADDGGDYDQDVIDALEAAENKTELVRAAIRAFVKEEK